MHNFHIIEKSFIRIILST